MSLFWDQRRKAPQLWTYPVFVILAIAVFAGIYIYGLQKAEQMPLESEEQVQASSR